MDPMPTRPNESNRVPLGDRGWLGVDMRVDPALLAPGYAALGINTRFEAGVPQTRKGRVIVPWLCQLSGTNVSPWGVVYGRGNFNDPSTRRRYTLFAADGGIYRTLANNAPVAMTLPAGESITNTVRFTQAFNRVFCHRGFNLPTLMLESVDGAWQYIDEPAAATGLVVMQNVERSLFLSDRLFTLQEDDEIGASDIGEPRYYLPFLQELAIKQGSDDDLVALAKLGKGTLIGLKDKSLHAVYNVRGDLSELQQAELTDEFGCVAPDAVSRVGNELWILSQIGLVAIEEYAANEQQSFLKIKTRTNEAGQIVPDRISAPLQPLFDRINWQYVHLARSARVGTKYYLALPIDRAEVFGPELAGQGGLYDTNEEYVITGLVTGATYRWTKGAEQAVASYHLANGTEQLDDSCDFVAQGTTVTLYGLGTITASVRRVTKGALNVMAVYDQENAAWSGYDEADDFGIVDLWVDLFRGRERLFVSDTNGWQWLYEETAEDALPQPYVDIAVAATFTGGVLRINAGTLCTGQSGSQNTAPNLWGAGTVTDAIQNMWVDSADQGGFHPGAVSPWSAPNTLPVKTATGVRFYSTNGLIPVLNTIDTDVLTVTYGKTVPIRTTFRSRAYSLPSSNRVRGYRLTLNWQTWSPELNVDVIAPGVNEVRAVLADHTLSRSTYTRPAHTPDYVLDNTNGDHGEPYREDYSVKFGTGGAAAGETEEIDLDASGGVAWDLMQESRYNKRVSGMRDRALQVDIVNVDGRFKLQSLAVEAGDERGNDGFVN